MSRVGRKSTLSMGYDGERVGKAAGGHVYPLLAHAPEEVRICNGRTAHLPKQCNPYTHGSILNDYDR